VPLGLVVVLLQVHGIVCCCDRPASLRPDPTPLSPRASPTTRSQSIHRFHDSQLDDISAMCEGRFADYIHLAPLNHVSTTSEALDPTICNDILSNSRPLVRR
jgi:hypothetical protein